MEDDQDYFTESLDLDYSRPVNPDLIRQAATMQQSSNYGLASTVAGSIGLAPLDLIDTVASSLPTGIERGEINTKVLQALDSEGLTNFYNERKGAIEVASGIGGIVATEIGVGKALKAARPFVSGMKTSSIARGVMALDTNYKRALVSVRQIDRQLNATTGGLEAMQYSASVRGALEVTRAQAANKARAWGAARVGARTAVSEAAMAAVLNQNDFLFDDDVATNLMWAGLGVVGGGAVSSVWSNYAMRKFNNSDMQRRVIAGAFDPTGLERSRIGAATAPTKIPDYTPRVMSSSHWFDEATSYLVDAAAELGEGVDRTLGRAQAVQKQQLAMTALTKASVGGIPGVSASGFTGANKAEWGAVVDMSLRDPSAFIGAEFVGRGKSGSYGIKQFYDAAAAREKEILESLNSRKLKNAQRDDLRAELSQVKMNQTLVPLGVVDGELVTPATLDVFNDWAEPVLREELSRKGEVGRVWAIDTAGKPLGIEMDDNLQIYLPKSKNTIPKGADIGKLDVKEIGALYRVGAKLIRNKIALGHMMQMPAKPTWFHLDMAEEFIKKTGDPSKVLWPKGLTREMAQVESFAQKVDIVRAADSKTVDGLELDALELLRFKLNLPRVSAYEKGLMMDSASPLDVFLRGEYVDGAAVRQMPLHQLVQDLTSAKRLSDVASTQAIEAKDLRGNGFNFLTESTTPAPGMDPKTVAPLLVMKRPMNESSWLKDNLVERLQTAKMTRVSTMLDQRASPMIRQLAQMLGGSADLRLATQTSGLSDLQQQASLPFMGNLSPSSKTRRIADGLLTAEMRARDNPTLLATQRARSSADQASQQIMTETFEKVLGDSLNRLASPRNTGSHIIVNHFYSHAGGWELEKAAKQLDIPGAKAADGTPVKGYAWQMQDTAANRQRWVEQFGESTPFPVDRLLRDAAGKTIYADKLAHEVLSRMDELAGVKLLNDNTMRRANGLQEAGRLHWYVPPPDVEGKIIGYGLNRQGQIVRGTAIAANTEEEFNRQLKRLKEMDNSPLMQAGVTFTRKKDIEAHATLLDRAQMEMNNPGWMPLVGQFKGMGKMAKAETDMAAFDTVLGTYRSHMLRQGREVMEAYAKEAIDAARLRSEVISPVGKNEAERVGGKNVYDTWLEQFRGVSPLSSPKSFWGEVQRPLESAYNGFVTEGGELVRRELSPAAQKAHQMVDPYLRRANIFNLSPKEKAAWEEMRDGLGEAIPFKSVTEYLESQGRAKVPADMRKHMAGLQSFSATWVLRVMETMQPFMNMAGVVNAAPAVIRSLQRLPGESAAAHASRVGHLADTFTMPDGAAISQLSVAKLMLSSFKKAWNRKSAPDFRRLSGKGMLSQSVSELQVAFNETQMGNRGAVKHFLDGDPRADNEFAKKGLIGWASVLSDESEHLSRSWGHFAGEEVGRLMGVRGTDKLDNFAHDFANKLIANYSPLNRPEVFQGALGAPIALFMSFITAYYQRVFRYVETRDMGALATQYAWQAGLFGVETVPGYAELEGLLQDKGVEELPYDVAVRRFGQNTADVLMMGTLGNIPKLFGAKDGVDFTSRGDVEMRLPVLSQMPAVVSVAGKMIGGTVEAIQSLRDGGLTDQRVAEIMSNSLPNRPIAGIIESAAMGGADIDATGQIAVQTKNGFDTTMRVLGGRSIQNANELDAFYKNRTAQEIQASKQERLRKDTRAAIRNGAMPEDLHDMFERYVETGGRPENYKRWLKNQFNDALVSRGERQLKEMLRNPAMAERAQRLINANVSLQEEEEEAATPLPEATLDDWND